MAGWAWEEVTLYFVPLYSRLLTPYRSSRSACRPAKVGKPHSFAFGPHTHHPEPGAGPRPQVGTYGMLMFFPKFDAYKRHTYRQYSTWFAKTTLNMTCLSPSLVSPNRLDTLRATVYLTSTKRKENKQASNCPRLLTCSLSYQFLFGAPELCQGKVSPITLPPWQRHVVNINSRPPAAVTQQPAPLLHTSPYPSGCAASPFAGMIPHLSTVLRGEIQSVVPCVPCGLPSGQVCLAGPPRWPVTHSARV